MRRILLSIYLVFLLATFLFAQNRNISGKITNDAGEALPGTTVLVKGTQIGTTSDANGAYALEVPETYNVLEFQFLGYATQEVEINGQKQIDRV